MKKSRSVSTRSVPALLAVLLAAAAWSTAARAETFEFKFGGPGVSGDLTLTYGAATDARYSSAFEVTAISGTFTDASLGLTNVPIGALVAVNHATPEDTNLLAPNDFSKFAVAAGLEHGSLSYDNLFWPGGSPQTATDYPFFGGFFDIYGLMFDIGDGRVVNVWSNGTGPTGVLDYGVAVATADLALDYVADGVVPVPEPSEFALLGVGLLALLAWRRRLHRAV